VTHTALTGDCNLTGPIRRAGQCSLGDDGTTERLGSRPVQEGLRQGCEHGDCVPSCVLLPPTSSKGKCLNSVSTDTYIRQPNLLPDLLAALTPRLDHARVVKILQNEDHLPLAKPYLTATQRLNITVVNEAYNDLLIEEEDHVTLRSSLETFDQYDAIKLAKRLENHELLEFRRIASLLYRVSRSLQNYNVMLMATVEQHVRRVACPF